MVKSKCKYPKYSQKKKSTPTSYKVHYWEKFNVIHVHIGMQSNTYAEE